MAQANFKDGTPLYAADLNNAVNTRLDLSAGAVNTVQGQVSYASTAAVQMPRLTTTQRDALYTSTFLAGLPDAGRGLYFWNISINQMQIWDGNQWTVAGSGTTNESADGTTVTTVGPTIVNAYNEQFSLNSNQQVVANGVADTTTSFVTELYYHDHLVYQKNTANQWWYKAHAADAWTSCPDPTATGVQAERIADYYDRMGTSISPNWTNWDLPSAHVTAMQYCGLMWARYGIYTPGDYGTATIDALKAAGIKFTSNICQDNGINHFTSGEMATWASSSISGYGSSLIAFEGPNECNTQNQGYVSSDGSNTLDTNSTGAAGVNAAKFMVDLKNVIRAAPGGGSIPIINFSLSGADSGWSSYVTNAGDLSATCDYGNWHAYCQVNGYAVQPFAADNGPPSAISSAQRNVPGKGVFLTEWGISPIGQAYEQAAPEGGGKIALNTFFDAQVKARQLGVPVYSAIFSLFDVTGEGFGIMNTDGTSRQKVADYLHNQYQIIQDTGATARTFTPGNLNYTVQGLPANGNHLLYACSNGDFLIGINNEDAVTDSAGNNVTPTAQNVTIIFGSPMKTVSVWDPVISGTVARQSLSNASQVQLTLQGYVKWIRITPN